MQVQGPVDTTVATRLEAALAHRAVNGMGTVVETIEVSNGGK